MQDNQQLNKFRSEISFSKELVKIFMKLINEKLPSFLDYCIQTRNAQPLEEVIYIISLNKFDYKG